MKIKTYIIDAFTREAFKGNPAGVCLLEQPLTEAQMQAIAAEMNLSETAFLVQDPNQAFAFGIRYFTPTVEIAFCGHATLASAKLVLEKLELEQVTFTTKQHLVLHAIKEADHLLMRFPLYDYQPHESLPGLFDALSLPPSYPLYLSEPLQMLLLEVPDKQTLLQLRPDFDRLVRLLDTVNGLAVTTRSEDPEYDFYSRCFWPWVGINEDPVTGSAHSALASYWSHKLQKTELRAFQLSARGGYLHLTIKEDHTLEVRSQAQIVLEGELHLN
ncbi:PhzF family phenazine biosynthesis protein [Rufibacter sediminis]|uniref:PhzF family phenazine biosynthesis protein n=1 Tax=Rufibacter sediminis TaxID=2762756 RepID=A0ABR6VZJ8_9BACT|nr:PhzF family phenazine biosynthesis protein [Rufibacter sediminis]MBC3542340.1 PhzF family phenazine biosynthesis protein [Rufibacter sediminis]